jgi:hypothetical protein
MLDDDSNITSDTLGTMNQVSHYFKAFKKKMVKELGRDVDIAINGQQPSPFARMLGFFSRDL